MWTLSPLQARRIHTRKSCKGRAVSAGGGRERVPQPGGAFKRLEWSSKQRLGAYGNPRVCLGVVCMVQGTGLQVHLKCRLYKQKSGAYQRLAAFCSKYISFAGKKRPGDGLTLLMRSEHTLYSLASFWLENCPCSRLDCTLITMQSMVAWVLCMFRTRHPAFSGTDSMQGSVPKTLMRLQSRSLHSQDGYACSR